MRPGPPGARRHLSEFPQPLRMPSPASSLPAPTRAPRSPVRWGAGLGASVLLVVACSDAVGPPVPAVVDFALASMELTYLGETAQLSATVRDEAGRAMTAVERVWTSADESVVTVSPGGLVTARGNGSTGVTLSAGGASASIPVTVAQLPTAVSVSPDGWSFQSPDDTVQLTAATVDAGGSPVPGAQVTWTSSDTAVAVVDAGGTVRAVDTGVAYIRATAGVGVDSVRVELESELVLVGMDPGATELPVVSQLTLTARVTDRLGTPLAGAVVHWWTDPQAGAIVSDSTTVSGSDGFAHATWVLGTGVGEQRAHAAVENRGQTASTTYSVTAVAGPAARASLQADSILLSGVGEEAMFLPTVTDAWGNPTSGAVVWSSDTPGVASVDGQGLTRATGVGATWIRAGLDEPTDSVQVTVSMRGAITLTFDDGWRSVYENAWPVIQEYPGLRANVAVYSAAVGWDGFLTEAQLDDLHQNGWSMVSHTVNHADLTTLTEAERDLELRESQEWLLARGYRGSNVLIAPYHRFDEAVRAAAGQYYDAARIMSATETVPATLEAWMPDAPLQLTAVEPEVLGYTTAAGREEVRALLQQTVDEGAFLDVFFHQVPPENVDAFRALMDILWEFRDRVLPYHELFPVAPREVR